MNREDRVRGPGEDRGLRMDKVLTERGRFLNRFIWQLVLEPPPSRKKGSRPALGRARR